MSDPLLAALESQWSGVKIVLPPADTDNGNDNQEENPEYIISLTQKKTQEEIRKLQIANETALNNLIQKKMIQAILESVGQSIQVAFVDSGRREAPTMAATLGIPEKERDIEGMINAMIERGVDAVIKNIEKLASEGTFS